MLLLHKTSDIYQTVQNTIYEYVIFVQYERRLFIDIFYLERIESKNVVVKLPKNLYIGEHSGSSRNLKNCEEKTLITLYIKYKPQLRSQSFHKGGGAKVHLLALYTVCTVLSIAPSLKHRNAKLIQRNLCIYFSFFNTFKFLWPRWLKHMK